MRIDLVKQISNKVITDLKGKADNTYKEMNDKLGERFLREMESIKMLCSFIKFSIESKQKIKRELVLLQDEFLIDDVKNLFDLFLFLYI
jgi:GTPase involved in cell partitioning and DNA repair